MNPLSSIESGLIRATGQLLARRGARASLLVLIYHRVLAAPDAMLPSEPDAASFAQQMDLLAGNFVVLPLREGVARLRGGKLPARAVCITFDDGYANNLEWALPVLRRNGFTATCYVVSSQIGGSNVWDHEQGVPARALMDQPQLQAWVSAGQELGAHTSNHIDLTRVDERTAYREMADCKRDLENQLGIVVRHFCYPYGRYGPQLMALARQLGFVTATTTDRARARPTDDAFALPRVPILRSSTLPMFWVKLATAYEDGKRS